MHFPSLIAACLIAPVPVFASTNTYADASTDECVDANANAQRLQREGHFRAARERLQMCVAASCPAIVRDDCALRLDQLERLQPTIVFDVKDALGNDLSDVRVTIDGQPLAETLEGTSLRVDPGEHTFAFETPGRPPVMRRFVLHEGEKARRERIVLAASQSETASSSLSPGPTAASTNAERQQGGGGERKALALVVGGLGIGGIAVGSVFGLLTISKWNNSKSECNQTTCSQPDQAVSDHDAAITDGTISTIGFIAGAVLAGAGLTLWLTAPSDSGPPMKRAQSIRVSPTVGAGAIGANVGGEF